MTKTPATSLSETSNSISNESNKTMSTKIDSATETKILPIIMGPNYRKFFPTAEDMGEEEEQAILERDAKIGAI